VAAPAAAACGDQDLGTVEQEGTTPAGSGLATLTGAAAPVPAAGLEAAEVICIFTLTTDDHGERVSGCHGDGRDDIASGAAWPS
jgi:hypothetical protein